MSLSLQIRRKECRGGSIPAYSTAQLLHGVCHLVHIPRAARQAAIENLRAAQPEGVERSASARQAKSRAKFETNKPAIQKMLAEKRGLESISRNFGIGYKQLRKYLKEESK